MTSNAPAANPVNNNVPSNPRPNLSHRDGLVEERTYWLALSHLTKFMQVGAGFYSFWLTRKLVTTTLITHVVDSHGTQNYKITTVNPACLDNLFRNALLCLGSSFLLNFVDGFFNAQYNRKRKQVKHL